MHSGIDFEGSKNNYTIEGPVVKIGHLIVIIAQQHITVYHIPITGYRLLVTACLPAGRVHPSLHMADFLTRTLPNTTDYRLPVTFSSYSTLTLIPSLWLENSGAYMH